jgi:hypothetical protein
VRVNIFWLYSFFATHLICETFIITNCKS